MTGLGNKDKQTGCWRQEKEMVMVQGDWQSRRMDAHPGGLD